MLIESRNFEMKKIKLCFSFVLLLSCFQNAFAQLDNSLLWKISGNELAQPSYLFGTVHLICPDDYVWTDKMQHALEQTDQLVLEVALNDTSAMNEFVEEGSAGLPADSTIRDFFTEAEFDTLEVYFRDSLRILMDPFMPYRPFVMYGSLSLLALGCDDPVSYEEDLIAKNAARGVHKVIGLETLEEQGDYANAMPQDSMSHMIMDMAKNMKMHQKETKRMAQNYAQQKLSAIADMINHSPLFRDNLVNNRNKNWIPRIEKIIRETPAFIAVGAGHLGGDDGLIMLLREAGYRVEAVL